jgi:hypothetical protein
MASLAYLKTHMVHTLLHHVWITGNIRLHRHSSESTPWFSLFMKISSD